ncbi:hypothetical protein [Cupriavidus pinatubonensis]|uniref:hypothetical protein n=1 Tax=Cupriavidus pinatubonensis TaxID=248026 RepID=UPI0015E29EA2|nr:hypothetical protein [Cupriavidus pinatubonensis]
MERFKQIIHTLRNDKQARNYAVGAVAVILFICWWGATGHFDNDPWLPSFLR